MKLFFGGGGALLLLLCVSRVSTAWQSACGGYHDHYYVSDQGILFNAAGALVAEVIGVACGAAPHFLALVTRGTCAALISSAGIERHAGDCQEAGSRSGPLLYARFTRLGSVVAALRLPPFRYADARRSGVLPHDSIVFTAVDLGADRLIFGDEWGVVSADLPPSHAVVSLAVGPLGVATVIMRVLSIHADGSARLWRAEGNGRLEPGGSAASEWRACAWSDYRMYALSSDDGLWTIDEAPDGQLLAVRLTPPMQNSVPPARVALYYHHAYDDHNAEWRGIDLDAERHFALQQPPQPQEAEAGVVFFFFGFFVFLFFLRKRLTRCGRVPLPRGDAAADAK